MKTNRGKDASPSPADDQSARSAADAKLLTLRAKIVASGRRLLDWEDIEREVAERRGGIGDAATTP